MKLDGILPLDKPVGMSSNQALQRAKRILRACKAGHTGSLDPIATGLVLLCFGEATKISQFLLEADKRYWVDIKLGQTTDSYDSEGQILETRPVETGRRRIEKALRQFQGRISQTPPMFSAIKQNGQPLYKLARQGIEVERKPREVEIYEISIEDFSEDRLRLEIHCSKGTYIRSLAHDLGQILGCGAHVVGLRRLQAGSFTIDQAVTMETLQETPAEEHAGLLLPADQALLDLPEVSLTSLATHYLLQGQPVSVRHSHPPGWVRLYAEGAQFLGMGQVLDDGRVAPKRLMQTPQKV
ncbi:MAG TPA: tRNA pseudouridine(55) synthase TruB [Acidiferrobacteraceae bacterium]|nr:tRNA pseudouridine(55) synthase TruB [Acidiferrobacteraceae bacterium]HEX20347.1 tRNA pseudouridine(55) synthase TruB [Acidiferrobacteraceae bacterium]